MDPSFSALEYNRVIQEYNQGYFVSLRTVRKSASNNSEKLWLEVITLENQCFLLEITDNQWKLRPESSESISDSPTVSHKAKTVDSNCPPIACFDSFEIFANRYSPLFQQRFQQNLYESLCNLR